MQNLVVLALLLSLTLPSLSQSYCSSACIDYTGACFNETPQGCWVCATSVYDMNVAIGSSCSILTQTNVLATQLPNSPTMSLFGYTTSNPTPITCTNYTFSGQYISTDYIAKNFTSIPLNHYAIVVRFNIGYMGQWNMTDVLRLTLQDSAQTVNYDYNYSCQESENICGQTYNTSDCIRIREFTLTHNTSYVFLNFSALTNQTNATEQSWGIKELIVAAKQCHPYCQTCFGGANTNCMSCATGYYLQGNVCLPECQNTLYKIVDQRLCSSVCPSGYYSLTASNGTKSCQNCPSGCLVCSSSSSCQAWQGQQAYIPDLWRDKMEFWILLIIVVVVVVAIIVYKIVRSALQPKGELEEKLNSNGDEKSSKDGKESKKKSSSSDEEKKNDMQSKMHLGSEANVAESIVLPDSKLWFNELVELEPQEVKITRPRRKRRSPPESEKPGSITDALQGITSNAEL